MPTSAFDYTRAFSRHIGLLTPTEQARLRETTVGIPGLGGVGGFHLLSLARLGVGRFTIADHDTFELENFNRQVGATLDTIGRPKTDTMAAMARSINPDLTIRDLADGIHQGNIDDFLSGCSVVIDGLDFFQIQARRLLFRRAHELGIPVITCGPLGFSVATLIFTADSPTFDAFMAIDDSMSELEQLIRFAVGLAPAGLHIPYLDPNAISFTERRGPSTVIAVELCAAIAATEVLNVILKRQPPLAVPRYSQFDPYRRRYRIGRLPRGNRQLLQRLKIWYVKRRFGSG